MENTDVREPTTSPIPAPRGEPTIVLERERPSEPVEYTPQAADLPIRSTTLTLLGLVWAVASMAAGAVGVHEALAAAEVSDRPWLPRAFGYADGLGPSGNVVAVAAVAGLAGLVLVVIALWPRRRNRIELDSPVGVYVRQRHLERLLAGRMETLDGVLRCRVNARHHLVDVEARGIAGVEPGLLYGRLASQAAGDLDLLPERPDVRILVREAH